MYIPDSFNFDTVSFLVYRAKNRSVTVLWLICLCNIWRIGNNPIILNKFESSVFHYFCNLENPITCKKVFEWQALTKSFSYALIKVQFHFFWRTGPICGKKLLGIIKLHFDYCCLVYSSYRYDLGIMFMQKVLLCNGIGSEKVESLIRLTEV